MLDRVSWQEISVLDPSGYPELLCRVLGHCPSSLKQEMDSSGDDTSITLRVFAPVRNLRVTQRTMATGNCTALSSHLHLHQRQSGPKVVSPRTPVQSNRQVFPSRPRKASLRAIPKVVVIHLGVVILLTIMDSKVVV